MSATPESRCFLIRKRAHSHLKSRTRGGVSGERDLCVPDEGDRVSSLLPTPQIPTSTRTSSTGSVALSFVRSRQARGEMTETSQLSTHCVPPGFPSPLVPETALRLSGPIWQCLESFGVITMRRELLASIWGVGAGAVATHLTMHRTVPKQRTAPPKISTVPWIILQGKGTLFAEETAEEL